MLSSELDSAAIQDSARPWVSVVIATYNSEHKLRPLLRSLAGQVAPKKQDRMQVLVVDGGSTDLTREIAKEYGAVVIDNPETNAISAKSLGFRASEARYVVFLDHDERLVDSRSLIRKISLMQSDPSIRCVFTSGYKVDDADSASNSYASAFGDPLTLYLYRQTCLEGRIDVIRKRFRMLSENADAIVFAANSNTRSVLLEIAACGSIMDKQFVLDSHEQVSHDANLFIQLFYLLGANGCQDSFAVMKNDPIIHESVDSWTSVFIKIRWRVRNAISDPFKVGASGISGRDKSLDNQIAARVRRIRLNIKKAMFVPYSVLVFPALIDSMSLAIRRRKVGYLMHVPLSIFVIWVSLLTLFQRFTPSQVEQVHYDGTRVDTVQK